MHIRQKVMYGLVGFAAAALLLVAPLAMAESGSGKNTRGGDDQKGKSEVRAIRGILGAKPFTVSVSIGEKGKVEVRGAVVDSTSNTGFVAKSKWGSTTLTWNVVATSSTAQFFDKDGKGGDRNHKPITLSDIQVGDTVDFNGALDTSASSLTVLARAVHNRSAVVKPVEHVKDVFQGILQSLTSTTPPTTFTLKVGGTVYTVNVSNATSIINSAFAPVSLSAFQAGDTIRIYGSANASSTIDALVVRDASI